MRSGEELLRSSTLSDVVGAWKVVSSSYQPRSVDYFLIRDNRTGVAIFRSGEFEAHSDLVSKIDAARRSREPWAMWREFTFSDGRLKFVASGLEELSTHWFRTAIRPGRMLVCDGFIELAHGDIVWAEFFPDPNRRTEETSPAPDVNVDESAAQPKSIPASIVPPTVASAGDGLFATIDSAPQLPVPLEYPMFRAALISPQPLREYLLRRLPKPKKEGWFWWEFFAEFLSS